MSYKPVKPAILNRQLGLVGAIFLTISAITPASSVFIIIPGIITQAGTGTVLSLLLASLIGVIVALIYSELSSSFPSAGGEYVMVNETIGSLPSFIVLVVNAIVMILISSVLALGAGDYLSKLFPIPPAGAAMILIMIATLVGVANIRLNAWVTGCFLAIELASIGYLIFLGTTHFTGGFSQLLFNPVVSNGIILAHAPAISIVIAAAVAAFAFNGYEQAVYLTEEIVSVRKNIPFIILFSLLVTLFIEIVPTALTVMMMRYNVHELSSTSIFYDTILTFGGHRVANIIAGGIVIAVFNAAIVNILMTARFIYSTARDGYWGSTLGGRLGAILKGQRTPWIATFLAGVVSTLVCLVPLQVLLVLTGTGLLIVYGILCVAALTGRLSGASKAAEFRAPFFPLLPLAGLIGIGGILAANYLDPVIGRPSILVTAIIVGIAIVAFYIFKGRIPKRLLWSDSSET